MSAPPDRQPFVPMDAAAIDRRYRAQIARLFEHSAFYRDKLSAAGFAEAQDVGGLDRIASLPFTEKDELRRSRDEAHPIGTHLAVPMEEIVRIYSTSGTTGTPSYIPLTREDLQDWIEISCRSYGAAGVTAGERMVSTYNAGPFVAGVDAGCLRQAWPVSYTGRRRQYGAPDGGRPVSEADRARLYAVLCPSSGRVGARHAASTLSIRASGAFSLPASRAEANPRCAPGCRRPGARR